VNLQLTVSVVIPFYNEAEQVALTIDAVRSVLQTAGESYEIVAIDDGSKDETAELLFCEAERGDVRALSFSRNFGKEAALCAGLEAAAGDAVIVMDGDLQHPPQHIPAMLSLWREGYKVVEGVKSTRGRESLLSRLNARFFYRTFARLSGYDLNNASDFKLLDREVVEEWKRLGERGTFFRALSAWLGYKRTQFTFEVAPRTTGRSGWSFFNLLKLSINAITGFSARPLYLIALIGGLLLIGFLILGIQTLISYFSGVAVEGFTTVILLQLLIGGATLSALGLIGVYIGRIFEEVKGRPRFIIERDSGG
jgi:glycosyltransferase involved in cell wall biosynthesis